MVLNDNDQIVLIQKGEIPTAEELETYIVARHSPGLHEKIKKGIVGVAGLGGLGSSVAIALARMGVGTLILVDFDVIEPSNLNRQQYVLSNLGQLKTEALANIIEKINPNVRVIIKTVLLDENNIFSVFQPVTIAVECLDTSKAKATFINTISRSLPDIYIVAASGIAGYGRSNRIQTRRLNRKLFVVGDLTIPAGPNEGLMAPRVGIAAHHQANLVISLLIDPEILEL